MPISVPLGTDDVVVPFAGTKHLRELVLIRHRQQLAPPRFVVEGAPDVLWRLAAEETDVRLISDHLAAVRGAAGTELDAAVRVLPGDPGLEPQLEVAVLLCGAEKLVARDRSVLRLPATTAPSSTRKSSWSPSQPAKLSPSNSGTKLSACSPPGGVLRRAVPRMNRGRGAGQREASGDGKEDVDRSRGKTLHGSPPAHAPPTNRRRRTDLVRTVRRDSIPGEGHGCHEPAGALQWAPQRPDFSRRYIGQGLVPTRDPSRGPTEAVADCDVQSV